MSDITIEYSVPQFDTFLSKLDVEKANAIKKRMRDYADDVFPLPFTHSCTDVGEFV